MKLFLTSALILSSITLTSAAEISTEDCSKISSSEMLRGSSSKAEILASNNVGTNSNTSSETSGEIRE